MIRTFLISLWAVVWTFIMASWAVLLGLVRRSDNLVHRLSAQVWARYLLRPTGIRVRVSGLDYIDSAHPCIFMPNHQSNFDIPILLSTIDVQFRFLAKKELFKIPVFGWGMKKAGYIPIDRSNSRAGVKSFLEAAEKIKNGASVIVFPEGTRTYDGQIGEFKKGGFSLAIAAQVPIYPVVIGGAWDVMPRGQLKIRPGNVDVTILPPVSTDEYSRKDVESVKEKVCAMMVAAFSAENENK